MTFNKLTKDQQKEAIFDQQSEEKPESEKKGKFFEFIQDVDKLDKQDTSAA